MFTAVVGADVLTRVLSAAPRSRSGPSTVWALERRSAPRRGASTHRRRGGLLPSEVHHPHRGPLAVEAAHRRAGPHVLEAAVQQDRVVAGGAGPGPQRPADVEPVAAVHLDYLAAPPEASRRVDAAVVPEVPRTLQVAGVLAGRAVEAAGHVERWNA